MKRRKFIPSTFRSTYGHSKESTRCHEQRVQILPQTTSDFVRAGQVIGSSYRAIEELVHNSVVHGRAKEIRITVGTVGGGTGSVASNGYLKVEDDGIGIDEESTRDFIGTQHCSSQIFLNKETGQPSNNNTDTDGLHYSCKGETLKALACLSVEFRVATTSVVVKRIDDASCETRTPSCFGKGISVPARPRKRKYEQDYLDTTVKKERSRKKPDMTCSMEKIVRNNETVAFRSIRNHDDIVKHTGTCIQLFGLFYKHHVRLRQHQVLQDASQAVQMGKVRKYIQILAMAYPHVTIRLYHIGKNTVQDTVWAQSDSVSKIGPMFDIQRLSMHPLFHVAIKQRLLDLHAKDDTKKKGQFVKVFYSESFADGDVTSQVYAKDDRIVSAWNARKRFTGSGQKWNICGILYEIQSSVTFQNHDDDILPKSGSSRDSGFVFVNGRLCKQHATLSEMVFNMCHSHADKASSQWSFLLHITCPCTDINLLYDEYRSYSVIRQKERLNLLISNAIRNALDNDGKQRCDVKGSMSCESIGKFHDDWMTSKELDSSSSPSRSATKTGLALLYRSSRIICGERLRKRVKDCSSEKSTVKSVSKVPTVDKVEVNTVDKADRNGRDDADTSMDDIFQDAFCLLTRNGPCGDVTVPKESKNDKMSASIQTPKKLSAMTWTKSKLKALDTQIASITNMSPSRQPITITKDMLSKAKLVAQLDSKFIVVNMCGTICLVDQHAADERVGLERLEEALQKRLSSNDQIGHERFDLSKLKNIRVDHLMKCIPVKDPKSITISPNLSSVITTCKEIIKKWNFDFDHDPIHHRLVLKSLPAICERVATEKDFMQFVKVLGSQTTNAAMVQPAFVKRTLASYACRYAIMFGDTLEDATCRRLLSDLSKCELCFSCAHGRPSIVPLVDMNLIRDYEVQSNSKRLPTKSSSNSGPYIPIRFQHLY